MPLVRREGARVRAEEGLQMLERLEQRIGLSRSGWWLLKAEQASHRSQPTAQPPDDSVNRLQRKRQTQVVFYRGLDRRAAKQLNQQRPQERRRERVPWQHAREEKRKGFPAATALSAVRAKHPLASYERAVDHRRIVAAQHAVAVERATTPAMRAGVLLERKSTALNSS
jgi:hypothetical protein